MVNVDGRMDRQMDGWTDGWTNKRMETCMPKWPMLKQVRQLTAGLNSNHMHIFKPWKKDVQSCIKVGMKLYKELHSQGVLCLHIFKESEVRK